MVGARAERAGGMGARAERAGWWARESFFFSSQW